MRITAASVMVLGAAWLLAGCADGRTSPTGGAATTTAPVGGETAAGQREPAARALVEAAGRHDFNAASKDFDDEMRRQFSPEQFATAWAQIESQFGAYEKITGVTPTQVGGFDNYDISTAFASGSHVLRVTFDANGHVVGFHVMS